MQVLLEICVDSFESAVAAIDGGADRIELCSALSEGGLTPTVGLLREIKQFLSTNVPNRGTQHSIPVYCMIRCRRGNDFCFSTHEMRAMIWDMQQLKEHGADGFVFGALDESGKVHRDYCKQIIETAGSIPLTFHRAIDCTVESELKENLQIIAELGFTTILTSGLKPTASLGVKTIMEMKKIVSDLKMAGDRSLKLMPGSGVSAENVLMILQRTGSSAVHGSASITKPTENRTENSTTKDFVDPLPFKVCSRAKVEELRLLIDNIAL
ncbi:copper homeostasis protein cutC homolog [Anopheles nili]|uniref:copper homeostasis protein cutC homolog n=1 Tax=Anopheles nili TaxID=185578 RepID=UPI00237A96E7|nr:copper homeostasis protein cutC homolog [Anopheles nili]